MRLASVVLTLAACTAPPSATPTGGDPGTDPGVTPTSPSTSSSTTTPTLPTPTTCEPDLPAAGVVVTDPACDPELPSVQDPWSARLEQRLLEVSPAHTPVVGHLDDDDGDGVVGRGDLPEIVAVDRFAGSFGAALAVWSGGRPKLSFRDGFHEAIAPLVADVDGDGDGEIVVGRDGSWSAPIVALDAAGREVWRTPALDLQCLRDGPCATTAADLDGDGALEVIVGGHVLDGATGAVERVLELDTTWPVNFRGVLAADLDQDGVGEIVVGDRVFDATGAILWTVPGPAALSAMPALAQLDADPEAEVVIARFDELLLFEHDGTPLRRVELPGAAGTEGYVGPPCVGDLDGDGSSEIVVAGGDGLDAFGADGRLRWSRPMVGNEGTGQVTGMLGCATFDFDADGADEVVFGDAMGLRVMAGADGATRWGTPEYGGYTEGQVPVVADVDGDGAAEIVASSTGHLLNTNDWMGVQVYGHARGGWAPAGSTWGTHDFAGGAPGLGPTWTTPGRFRGRAVEAPEGAGADVTVEVVDRCGCESGELRLSVVVGNEGAVPAEAVLEVLAARPGGDTLLQEVAIGLIAPGTSAAAVEVVLAASEADSGLVVRVTGATCDPSDDEVALEAPCTDA